MRFYRALWVRVRTWALTLSWESLRVLSSQSSPPGGPISDRRSCRAPPQWSLVERPGAGVWDPRSHLSRKPQEHLEPSIQAQGSACKGPAAQLALPGHTSSWRLSFPASCPPAWSFSSHALSPGQLFIISFSKVFLRHGSYERCYTE